MPVHLLSSDPTASSCGVNGPAPTFTRRQFLVGVAAGGSALGVGLPSAAPTVLPKPIDAPKPDDWYALISDTHIAADPAHRMFGQNMVDNLRAVTSDVLAAGSPPLGVFIDGDLALKDGQPGDYRTLAKHLEPLRKAGLPIHLAMGNHDNRTNIRDVLRDALPSGTRVMDRQVSVMDAPGLRFLVLDSLETVGATHGRLGPVQLDWLGKELDAHPETPTILLVHHHPHHCKRPTPVPGLLDGEGLLALARPRRQVKALVFGHTHAWRVWEDDSLHLINLPAVAYHFHRKEPLGWCRLIPEPGGATLEMRCVGRNRRGARQKIELGWRSA
jgi:Icc protein